jgi:hypothetical protein
MPTVPPPSRDTLVRSFTSRDFASLRDELSNLILATLPDVWTDFFDSNLGLALIDMLALVGDVVTLGQDIAALEVFLATCERYESAVRFANSVGYRPRGATSAEVLVELSPIPTSVFTNGATIASGQSLKANNGLFYELLTDQTIPAGALTFEMSLFEGASFEETFNAASAPDYEAVVAEDGVVEGSWVVFIGATTNPSNIWREVDDLALETTASKTYETEITPDGKLLVRFGDNVRGAIPTNTITIQYRTCSGGAGNASVTSVGGNLTGVVLITLASVTLSFRNLTEAATGGNDRESTEEIKANVPAYLRSGDRIITLEDYSENALRVSGVAQAIAGPLLTSFSSNVIEVNVWGQETVNFTSESPGSGRRSTVSYDRFAVIETARLNDLHAFYTPRTLVTVQTIFQPREVAFADIYLNTVRYDSRFDADAVHEEITQAMIDVFEQSGGFLIALSDVFNKIDSIPSVVRFQIERIVFQRQSPTPATGTIGINGTSPLGGSVQISDGASTEDFEVNNGGALTIPTATPVATGADFMEFAANLKAAIEGILTLTVEIQVSTTGNVTLILTNDQNGIIGNVTITTANGWSIVLNPVTGMAGGSDTPVVILTDYRNDQVPDPDAYPVGPSYVPGEPFVVAGPPWLDDGFLPYRELTDLFFPNVVASRNFYNDRFLYNNEINYDATGGTAVPPQVINLRRLVFELQPDS